MAQDERVRIRRAEPKDAAAITGILRESFRDDPVMNWMLRADGRQESAWHDFFRANVDDYFASGRWVYVADDDAGTCRGAALWTPPPGAQRSPWRARLALWQLRGWTGLWRFPRFWRLVTATETRYPRQPHYYLFLIGVDPASQGGGIGRALVETVLRECDADDLPAYLESGNERNLSFYRRLGFEATEVLKLGWRGPPMWLMRRGPR